MSFIIFTFLLILLGVLSLRFGYDSRDGMRDLP